MALTAVRPQSASGLSEGQRHSGKSWQGIPFGRSFRSKRQNKKPLHRHQKSAGALLSLQNDVLCNGFEIQNHTVFMPLRR